MLIFLIILTALLTGADQLIKFWAVNELSGTGVSRPFISFGSREIINLTYTENTGAAFSMMSGKAWFTIGFTTVALILFAVYMIKNYRQSKSLMTVTAIVAAGGLGNLIDRIRLGYVVDYIEVRLFRFAIFNFADICVTVGMVLLLIFLFIVESRKKTTENTNG
ncbi:MAG: signal peptidase II [Oscillospiraceae bacterium]|nr:signal peptidase II [Oscillospiraceae bacterium]